jgi:hypothetical protein
VALDKADLVRVAPDRVALVNSALVDRVVPAAAAECEDRRCS